MRIMNSVLTFSALASSAAHAEGWTFEPKPYYSLLRLTAESSKTTIRKTNVFRDGVPLRDPPPVTTTDNPTSDAFHEGVGISLNGVTNWTAQTDIGFGFGAGIHELDSNADIYNYYLAGFLRQYIELAGGKLYGQVGFSFQQIQIPEQNVATDTNSGQTYHEDYNPFVNGDLAIGANYPAWGYDVGLQAGFTSSLLKSQGQVKAQDLYGRDSSTRYEYRIQTKQKGLALSEKIFAVTVGKKI